MTIVQNENCTPANEKNELSAIPVMIPGSAIGSRRSSENDSRPKNEKRWIANEAIVPRTRAIAVAARPTSTESRSDERRNSSCQATLNQCVDQSVIGQLWIGEALNAYSAMTTRGIH